MAWSDWKIEIAASGLAVILVGLQKFWNATTRKMLPTELAKIAATVEAIEDNIKTIIEHQNAATVVDAQQSTEIVNIKERIKRLEGVG